METTPSRSPTRRNDSSDSPEFAFWNLGRNPSPTLHSADELFSGGFLLPLHLIPPPTSDHDPEPMSHPEPESGPSSSTVTSSILMASKRWKEMIFKRVEKKHEHEHEEKSTDKIKREKKGLNNKSAELNINIWPFSRSRSAGNNTVRSRPSGSTGRKVSSAPCSRSNSSGSRRCVPNSPSRTGVHLGRTSPVWKVRRNRTGPGSDEAQRGKTVGKGRVLNLSVPMCIGYRQQLSCRVDENAAIGGGGNGGGGAGDVSGGGDEGRSSSGDSGGNGNLFSLRGFFSKKGVLTA